MAVSIHPKLETGLMADSNAAFIAFICNDVKQYVNTPESWGVRDKKVTLLGMTSRYDSTQGFIGGMVDPGETTLQAAARECKEEAGYDVDIDRLHLVCTHKIRDNMNAHLYACSVSVEEMYEIKPLAAHNLIPDMIKELPAYLVAAASCTSFNHADVAEFTDAILKWWGFNHPKFPAWAKAARLIFAMLPSSAPSERACCGA